MLLAVGWSWVVPISGGADEPRHLRYVEIVALQHRLPAPAEKVPAISHHPPLHYLIAAPWYLAGRAMGGNGPWRMLRLLSNLMGALALYLLWRTLLLIMPERRFVAGLGVLMVGWLPHYLLVCALVSNDATSIAASMMVLYLATLYIVRGGGLKLAALCGLSAGAAVLVRHNTLPIVAAAGAGIVLAAVIARRDDGLSTGSRAVRAAGAFALPLLLTGGVWLARHLTAWGRLDSDAPWHEAAWPVHTLGGKLLWAASGLYRSAWCQVGWLPGPHSTPPPGPSPLFPRPDLETTVLLLALPLAVVGLVGTAIIVGRWLRDPASRERALALAMLIAGAALTWAALMHSAMHVHPGRFEGGRYLLPAAAGYLPLLAIGPLALPAKPRHVCWAGAVALLIAMNVISAWEMYAYLIPTFAQQ